MSLPPTPRDLPKRTYVSLTEALTWLLLNHAFESPQLLSWVDANARALDELQGGLDREWRDLADYACRGTIEIRGRRVGSSEELPLTVHALRNCRHVGWLFDEDSGLMIDPFRFTFSGGFRSQQESGLRGYTDVVVRRDDLINYKKVRPRLGDASLHNPWQDAERWLSEMLGSLDPISGLKAAATRFMVERFGITASRAGEIWTSTAKKLKWPLHGTPSKLDREKLVSIVKGWAV